MRLDVKAQILKYREEGRGVLEICKHLRSHHGCTVSRQAIHRFLRHGSLVRRRKLVTNSARKILAIHRRFIHMWLTQNNELTACDIQRKLKDLFRLSVSLSCVRKVRRELGWSSNTGKYCQQISHKNKKARMEWACNAIKNNDNFRNVVFADETSVEMCSHGKLFFHQSRSGIEMKTRKRSRPKHAYKVNVWAGISYQGKTPICIFTGIMNSVRYQQILESNLLPFVRHRGRFPGGFRLYQDNDSKHTSCSTKAWMEQAGIINSVMKTPASSPDLNPIENVWAGMKTFLQSTAKPKTKEELVSGIRSFWRTLTARQCARYIDHVHRVIPQVIMNNGEATNF